MSKRKKRPRVRINTQKVFTFGKHEFGTWGRSELMYAPSMKYLGKSISDDGLIRPVEPCNNLLWVFWNKDNPVASCAIDTTVGKLKKLVNSAEKFKRKIKRKAKRKNRQYLLGFYKHFGNVAFFFRE